MADKHFAVKLKSGELIFLLALLNSLTAFSTDSILPAQLEIGWEFHVTDHVSLQYIIAAVFIGMGFGEWFAGPMADSIGRRATMTIGIGSFALGAIAVLVAPSFSVFLLGRFIQGIGLAFVKISSRAMVRDLYSGDDMARVTSFMATILVFVPMIAPVIGQVMNDFWGWRSIAWFWLVGSAVLLLWIVERQPETLLQHHRRPVHLRSICMSAVSIVKTPSVFGVICALGCIWGAQLLYITNVKSIFFNIFSVTQHFGFFFAIVASSVGVSALLNGVLVNRLSAPRLAIAGLVLLFGFSTIDLLLLSLLTSYSFTVFIVLSWLKFCCFGFIFGNLNAIGMSSLSHMAGLGSTLMSGISSLIGLVLSAFFGLFYSLTLWSVFVGFLLLALCALISTRLALVHDGPSETTV